VDEGGHSTNAMVQVKDSMSKTESDYIVVEVEEAEKAVRAKDHFDEDLLHCAIKDAGRWAYGIVMVEIWVLKEDKTALFRPDGGWWIDPVWHECTDDVRRATDPSFPGYVPPPSLAPGVGLAGALWSETLSTTGRVADKQQYVIWRDLYSLQRDPDQPYDSRLKRFGECGLGFAGGVYFKNSGQQGLVVFLARTGVDLDKLRSETNETYMRSASDLIGSAWALRGPRRAVEMERKRELNAAVRRARIKIQAMIGMGISLSTLTDKPVPQKKQPHNMIELRDKVYNSGKSVASKLQYRLVVTAKKCKGAGVAPPPPFTIRSSLYTFLGVFG